MENDINRLSEDPFVSHHTIPSPPSIDLTHTIGAYADDAMGAGPGRDEAGGYFMGDTGWLRKCSDDEGITGGSREC
jgi:hypothetical protein